MAPSVVLVTGAASGIGQACVRALLHEGHLVVATDLRVEALEAALPTASPRLERRALDVTDAEVVDAVVDEVAAAHGRLDGAVNSAGVAGDGSLPGEMSVGAWRRVLDVNLDGVFHAVRAESRVMAATGRPGSIVNVGSVLSVVGGATSAGYAAAKHGVLGLTRSAALAYAAHGIRVNCVGPGFIDTPLLRSSVSDERQRELAAQHPLGRLGRAEEVADAVVWLISERSSFVTGAFVPVDGGFTTR